MMDLAAIVVRFTTIATIALLMGSVCFDAVVLRALRRGSAVERLCAPAVSDQLWRVSTWAAVVLIPCVLLRLLVQVRTFLSDAGWASTTVVITGSTVWGRGWDVQAVVVAVLLPLLVLRRRVAALLVLALAVTPALSGHALGDPIHPVLAVVSDTVHVVGAGAWIGTLALLVGVGIPSLTELSAGDRGAVAVVMVRAFSPLALASAAAVFLTGVVASWLHLDTVTDLWRTAYGLLLSAKILLFLLIVAAGAYNWRRATPRLGVAESGGVSALTRSASVELVLAVLLFGVTGVLGGTPLPGAG